MKRAPHGFKEGDRVRNGVAGALVVAVISDDFLVVQYDGSTAVADRVTELAIYFVKDDRGQE